MQFFRIRVRTEVSLVVFVLVLACCIDTLRIFCAHAQNGGQFHQRVMDPVSFPGEVTGQSSAPRVKILVDASRDGNLWWAGNRTFDPNLPHQGKALADLLRSQGITVTELRRPFTISCEQLSQYHLVMAVDGCATYSVSELSAYARYVSNGGRLILLNDHKGNSACDIDSLSRTFGLDFDGVTPSTNITTFARHPITANVVSLPYLAGSLVTTAPPSATTLGFLSRKPVMGVMPFGLGQVFFIGDTNGIEATPQPFVNNLLRFMLAGAQYVNACSSSGIIAFSSQRDGNQEVYLLDLATGRQTNLNKNSADDGYAKWSPDGEKIAFSTNRDSKWQVYIMNRDGTEQRNVTRDPHNTGYVDWSPNGRSLVFASGRYGPKDEIFTSGADGSNIKRLTNHPAEDVHPAWSPDGRRIAFASERDGNRQIYVMNVDGTDPSRMTRNGWYDDYPSWSPDGLQLAFASNRESGDSHRLDIYVMNADGSNVRRVVDGPGDDLHPTWSPDGKMLAFSSDRFGDRDIFIVNADGSGVMRVVSSPGNDEHPHWIGRTQKANPAIPPDQTVSGIYWPLGKEKYTPSRCGTWLGRDSSNGGCYFKGLYHLGVDMLADKGAPIYAIADGEVIGMSTDGEGNAAAFIKHRLSDGTPFVAVYGHIRTTVNTTNEKLVTGGVQFATVGSYSGGNHLHFAVRPGIGVPPTRSANDQNGNIVRIGWGRASNWFWPDTNGFVEPIGWIKPTTAVVRNQLGMEFVYVPPGSFIMGSNDGGADEKPVHRVVIKEGFYMGRHEVTQGQWQQIMGSTVQQKRNPNILGVLCEARQFPPTVGEGDRYPMYYVSWNEAQEFIRRLNEQNDRFIYRLPSEAEWEYSCRAGTMGDFAGNLDSMGWYEKNSGCHTHPVGTKQPNAFGLYDMHGNVREWCEDWYHDTYTGASTDGSAGLGGGEQKYRVLRGGAWGIGPQYLRSASRSRSVPWDNATPDHGFRVVATLRTP